MILDTFFYEGTKFIISYSAVWELFFSMHVLANPEHHISRKKWAKLKEEEYPDLIKEIRELSCLTDSWLLVIDSEKWEEISQLEIPDMLIFFRKKNIYQWNAWVKCSETGKEMCIQERNRILDVIERYYTYSFKMEETILRQYILQILQRERDKCKKEGVWSWCERIHSRLKITQNEIVYKKDQEYKYGKQEIDSVTITASTFVYPHLWMSNNKYRLEMVKSVMVENIKADIPEEFSNVFKALGDKTRLKIIQLLLQGICTTQALAKKMQLSEAAISKHLKIMLEAGLVRKIRKGVYIEYEFRMEVIDFIPYKFYETMLI
ncbi:ArsR family transcriptional regulator [Clostridium sp. AF19-22AC]|jgi:DNA-binding transcriptional ArsR family regulator|uniref:ArsR/SmtB family transcription factor n=1 Tax=Clostridia TaxID=186801 RepID=UPI000E5307A0|nr:MULTISPECIES: metalloregulator ArsR/SmtB family transcription factor [Clostridia]RHR22207.1 ArsR family transcriptional regulator [Clostridium sp. AF19-22AC]